MNSWTTRTFFIAFTMRAMRNLLLRLGVISHSQVLGVLIFIPFLFLIQNMLLVVVLWFKSSRVEVVGVLRYTFNLNWMLLPILVVWQLAQIWVTSILGVVHGDSINRLILQNNHRKCDGLSLWTVLPFDAHFYANEFDFVYYYYYNGIEVNKPNYFLNIFW